MIISNGGNIVLLMIDFHNLSKEHDYGYRSA